MSESCNRRLTLWLRSQLGQIGARRVSCFIPSRDPGRGEDLCSPGCETCSWRRAFVVEQPGGRVDWGEERPIDNSRILLEKGEILKQEDGDCG
jgi:hypothetical protein